MDRALKALFSNSETNSNNPSNTAPATRLGSGNGSGNGNLSGNPVIVNVLPNLSIADNWFGRRELAAPPQNKGVTAGQVATVAVAAVAVAGVTYGVTKLIENEEKKKQHSGAPRNTNGRLEGVPDLTTLEGAQRYVGYR
jgi:hypothetical protein